MPLPLRTLGASDLRVTAIGLGCWQFSKRRGISAKFWPTLPQEEIREIVRVSLEGGINWFDTAEVYGWGNSEEALAEALTAAGRAPGQVIVATKWWPRMLRTAGSIHRTIDVRLQRLGGFPIDLYQVHHPFSLSRTSAQMRAMARVVEQGKVRAVGVSNFSASQMREAHAVLGELGLKLTSNQVKYSLLDRRIEANGVLQAARELGVSIIAYSPLEQGLLSGKFHDDPGLIQGRPGFRKYMGAFKRERILASLPLIEALRELAQAHGVTPSQIALSWLVTFHGETVVAIPGATKVRHAAENVGALSVELPVSERARIDELSRQFARL